MSCLPTTLQHSIFPHPICHWHFTSSPPSTKLSFLPHHCHQSLHLCWRTQCHCLLLFKKTWEMSKMTCWPSQRALSHAVRYISTIDKVWFTPANILANNLWQFCLYAPKINHNNRPKKAVLHENLQCHSSLHDFERRISFNLKVLNCNTV